MNGGISESELVNMSRKKFMFYLDRLAKAKNDEVNEIKKVRKTPDKKQASGKM